MSPPQTPGAYGAGEAWDPGAYEMAPAAGGGGGGGGLPMVRDLVQDITRDLAHELIEES